MTILDIGHFCFVFVPALPGIVIRALSDF